jgi:hypothetical protein
MMMEIKDIIDVLESVKSRELANNEKVNRLCNNPSESIGAKAIDAAIDELVAYHDLGTPEQLTALMQEFASIKAAWDKNGGESLTTGLEAVFRELERYRQMKREGRFCELPCRVGSEIYDLDLHLKKAFKRSASLEDMLTLIKPLWGKRYFATRAEAEAALREANHA